MVVYCVGSVSYDERTALPWSVHLTLEGAKESVKSTRGHEWAHEHPEDGDEWTIVGWSTGDDLVIKRYEVQP